jgi:isoaspartyl peptidase/L-asparaginase-like protein (Ntn-hydrolase superfamily)
LFLEIDHMRRDRHGRLAAATSIGGMTNKCWGRVALPFNTGGMYRGWIRDNGERATAIFEEAG